MNNLETETIDKLFLELSQVTNATTSKEQHLEYLVKEAFFQGYKSGQYMESNVTTEYNKFKLNYMNFMG